MMDTGEMITSNEKVVSYLIRACIIVENGMRIRWWIVSWNSHRLEMMILMVFIVVLVLIMITSSSDKPKSVGLLEEMINDRFG